MPPTFRPARPKLGCAAIQANCFGDLVGFQSSLCARFQFLKRLAAWSSLRLVIPRSLNRLRGQCGVKTFRRRGRANYKYKERDKGDSATLEFHFFGRRLRFEANRR